MVLDDVVVLESPVKLSREAVERISRQLRETWPNRKLMILEGGLKLSFYPEAPEVDEILVEELVPR